VQAPTAWAKRTLVGLAATLTLVAALAAAPIRSQPTASQLDLRATLTFVEDPAAPCPPGSPASLSCPAGTAEGAVSGLGTVKATFTELLHTGPPLCSEGNFKFLGHPVRWVVPNKGEIDFAWAASECVAEGSAGATVAFTVTGGTDLYAGASGSGTVRHVASAVVDGKFRGSQMWTGTLSVPRLDLDVTAPTITGAANKTVKAKKGAKSARVTFQVTAEDDKDGALPVTCAPRSGSRFRIGMTRVTCEATDSSANTKAATFTVTVKRAR
jgi:hypothetical protein